VAIDRPKGRVTRRQKGGIQVRWSRSILGAHRVAPVEKWEVKIKFNM